VFDPFARRGADQISKNAEAPSGRALLGSGAKELPHLAAVLPPEGRGIQVEERRARTLEQAPGHDVTFFARAALTSTAMRAVSAFNTRIPSFVAL
jgi:hypothetical protein